MIPLRAIQYHSLAVSCTRRCMHRTVSRNLAGLSLWDSWYSHPNSDSYAGPESQPLLCLSTFSSLAVDIHFLRVEELEKKTSRPNHDIAYRYVPRISIIGCRSVHVLGVLLIKIYLFIDFATRPGCGSPSWHILGLHCNALGSICNIIRNTSGIPPLHARQNNVNNRTTSLLSCWTPNIYLYRRSTWMRDDSTTQRAPSGAGLMSHTNKAWRAVRPVDACGKPP